MNLKTLELLSKYSDSSLNALSKMYVNINDPQALKSIDSTNYINWNEFVSLNISTLEHVINQAKEVCSKYGGMVSVDPLGDKEDETIVWYSNGSSSDLTLPPNETIELGTVYYNCQ